ncbi:hypothetical protein [Paenirhodobacter populi]|uniref:hypothetical protein n=1 Tax=Paenirhodobacter populi TaxID=2306993 RepID=UPI0013E2BDB9|nr:hypothetical protein [Sinirhodobacter populi]
MNDDTPETKQPKGRNRPAPESREERLRDALRANLLRRKAQARARAAKDGEEGQEDE